jgi:extracellular elastinolytic metalloproteinase
MKLSVIRARFLISFCGLAALAAWPAWAAAPGDILGQHAVRNFDARASHNRTFRVEPAPIQLQALTTLEAQVPEVAVTFEETTGAARTLYNTTGYLTGPQGGDALAIARGFVEQHVGLLGLKAGDLEHEVTDDVFTRVTGARHVYLRQLHAGIPVYNGQLHVNVNRDGRVISVNNAFLPGLAASVAAPAPLLGAEAALAAAGRHLGLDGVKVMTLNRPEGPRQITRLRADALSSEEIEAGLMWLPIRAGDARLVWNFQLDVPGGEHWYDITVDAHSGKVWTRFDWVNSDSYRVYPQPVESPNHTTPLPPSDGRDLVSNPADSTASPLDWHDTGSTSFTIMRGNNVHAYEDADGNNQPPASQPSCGASLNCDFPINLSQAPSQYRPAAVANLFYWNNIIHDVQYQYGFDEAGGNFQVNNFGNGGAGNDDVRAEAQDGGGTNNANFATPTDGGRPRMQMYIWTAPNPDKDGDLDNGIVIHEYGHGISIRQVGGPNNSSCLNNAQQGGEGWSDWHTLVYTAEVGDQGTDGRGIGTYALNQPTTGQGIRTQRYSTSQSINNWTYASISGMAIPHGVGSVWAQGIWEVYWALVDQHGFDPDLYDAFGGAGNQRALLYINEGFKNTACSPTFVNARDGIIQAATDNFGGQDVCLIWEAFAAFGLGTNAVSGGSNSTNPTNGFNVPASCQCQPNAVANAGPDKNICEGDSTTIGTPALSGHSYSWSPGGATTAQVVVSPSSTTTYTVTATTACGSAQDSVTVFVGSGSGGGLDEDFEGGTSGWSATGLWHLATNSSCASPQNGYSSPVNAFYYGQDSSCNYNTGGANSGTLTSPVISGINSSSTLTFDYYRQVELYTAGSFDRTEVEIIHPGGTDTVFALDSGDSSSSSWQSSGSISLAAYAGDSIQVRFRFNSVDGVSNNFDGWFIDDVVVTGGTPCGGGGGECTVDDDFQGGAAGWSNSSASTCTTGAYVLGTPTFVSNGGVVTQPAGDHTTGSGNAIFTAFNTSAGVDDVDGGNCILDSPVWSVSEASELSVWYFHGQRDNGNNNTQDFFRLEVSTNGGSSYTPVVSIGDDTSQAVWTQATASIPAGSSVRLRVQASDAGTSGDLVEGGIDDLRICPSN